ncbi:MAG: hypothetical protein AAGH65_02990 [Pseudomonadota bacterium]
MFRLYFASLVAGLTALATMNVSHADTLLLEFDTRLSSAAINIPEQYADLNERFDENPTNGEFTVRLLLTDFDRFEQGTHEIPLNVGNALNWGRNRDQAPVIQTEGLFLTLDSRVFGPLEGVRTRADARTAAGDRVRAAVLVPDESQIADYGTLTVVDGMVTGFRYGWVEADNPGITSINDFLVDNRGFPVVMTSLTIEVSAFSAPVQIGDLTLVQGLSPEVSVDMAPTSD